MFIDPPSVPIRQFVIIRRVKLPDPGDAGSDLLLRLDILTDSFGEKHFEVRVC